MIEAMKANLGYTITKNYCKCSADHFDKNYNDNSLIELVEGEGGAAYNDVVAFVISKCRRKVGLEYINIDVKTFRVCGALFFIMR